MTGLKFLCFCYRHTFYTQNFYANFSKNLSGHTNPFNIPPQMSMFNCELSKFSTYSPMNLLSTSATKDSKTIFAGRRVYNNNNYTNSILVINIMRPNANRSRRFSKLQRDNYYRHLFLTKCSQRAIGVKTKIKLYDMPCTYRISSYKNEFGIELITTISDNTRHVIDGRSEKSRFGPQTYIRFVRVVNKLSLIAT